MRSLAVLAAAAFLLVAPALAAPYLGPEEPDGVTLNKSVTVAGPTVKLGDLFTGVTNYGDRVVTQAPRPGQRTVLSADFLANLARSYSVDWKPADQFDRVVVYRPGQTVTPDDLMAALKADLVMKGMPERSGLRVAGSLPTLVVPADAAPPVLVRESFFDSTTKSFHAVVEIAGADGTPLFMTLHGAMYPTLSVPVLKGEVARNAVITAEMVTAIDVPEDQVHSDTVMDANELIGKSPRGFVAPNKPLRTSDVTRLSLVDVPVLKTELRRDGVVRDTNITWATLTASELPSDVVTDPAYLIGKSPRSYVAAGAPIRRGDVLATRQVAMAVAARDLTNGTLLQKGDISWVPANDNEVAFGVVVDETQTHGRALLRPIRAGEAIRSIDLVRPKVVTRGKAVTIVYATGAMKLTVQGEALEDGGVSDTIRVANSNSKATVQAEVVDANTVRVMAAQQSAMQ